MCMLNEEMLEIILKKVLEELSRKGIDISSRKNQEEKPIKVSFLGKDNLLKAEQNELQSKYLAILNINMLKYYQNGMIK